MKIGIVGCGAIGSGLAGHWVKSGHEVEIANSRGPNTLAEVAEETGARPVTLEQAVEGKDAIVVSIPEGRVTELPSGLFDAVPAEVPVIDTGNYYPRERDGRIEPIEEGAVESEWVASQIGRPVIKTFNTINYLELRTLAKATGDPERVALPMAGDDGRSKEIVAGLLDDAGFDAVDAGALSESWRQQPATPVYLTYHPVERVRELLAEATPGRTEPFIGTAESPGSIDEPR